MSKEEPQKYIALFYFHGNKRETGRRYGRLKQENLFSIFRVSEKTISGAHGKIIKIQYIFLQLIRRVKVIKISVRENIVL